MFDWFSILNFFFFFVWSGCRFDSHHINVWLVFLWYNFSSSSSFPFVLCFYNDLVLCASPFLEHVAHSSIVFWCLALINMHILYYFAWCSSILLLLFIIITYHSLYRLLFGLSMFDNSPQNHSKDIWTIASQQVFWISQQEFWSIIDNFSIIIMTSRQPIVNRGKAKRRKCQLQIVAFRQIWQYSQSWRALAYVGILINNQIKVHDQVAKCFL